MFYTAQTLITHPQSSGQWLPLVLCRNCKEAGKRGPGPMVPTASINACSRRIPIVRCVILCSELCLNELAIVSIFIFVLFEV